MLYTKFEILEVQNYLEDFSIAMLRAKVQLPWGDPVNVFVAHIAWDGERHTQELASLSSEVVRFEKQDVIVMGDFNERSRKLDFGPGFSVIATNTSVDHIVASFGRTSDTREYTAKPQSIGPRGSNFRRISDHPPVVVTIGVSG